MSAVAQRKRAQTRQDLNLEREMPDRCEQLQQENHQVKKNFNDLELQIKKIEVMLRRKST